jgi:anti-anti-sigma factor
VTHLINEDDLRTLNKGGHVAWVVGDETSFAPVAAALIEQGVELGEKVIVFGPQDAKTLLELGPKAAAAADPHTAFLGGGPLVPDRIFEAFREQVAAARAEGFGGLRIIADMDWLLPSSPSVEDLVEFELLLDRVVADLGATVVCAYRSSSFPQDTQSAAVSVHPICTGTASPQFSMVAAGSGWALSGEIDIGVAQCFRAAITAVCRESTCVIDVGGVEFIDVSSLAMLAEACRSAGMPVRLAGVPRNVRRLWEAGDFERIARLEEVPA